LALQAQGGSRDAMTVLLERCRASLDRLVRSWSRTRGLRREELEDVRQEAGVAFLLAVKAYDPNQAGGRGQAYFGPLLNQVVRNHLENWDRRRRRAESHLERFADWAAECDRRALSPAREVFGLPPPDTRTGDPVGRTLWHEFWARLAVGLWRLDALQRWVFEQVQDSRSLHDLTGERGLSYDRAKRMLRRASALLRVAVR
jgi:hypothetical protein